MYENSPEYFKEFQKRFKYNICETEPKPENTTIENYAYGYLSSATVIEGCIFGSNHYHNMNEFDSQDDNIFDSLYVPAVIPCLVNCFKLLIQPTQKVLFNVVQLFHDYMLLLSTFQNQSSSVTKNQKQLPAPLSEGGSSKIY